MRLKIGDFVELIDEIGRPEERKGDFLQIHKIAQHAMTDEIVFHGLRLRRTHNAGGILPHKMNELYLEMQVRCDEEAEQHSPYVQNLERVKACQIVKKRRVNVTNTRYPLNTFRDHGHYNSDSRTARASAFTSYELACRWLLVRYYRSQRDLDQSRPQITVLRTFTEEEASPTCNIAMADEALVVNHTGHAKPPRRPTYSMLDSFCGLGGVSLGARQAGIIPAYAFDHDIAPVSSYTLNQPDTLVYLESVEDLLHRASFEAIAVDVLHLSPPCQPFSRAHRTPGQNDETNQAVLFSVRQLLERLHPRLVTLEEAEWLVRGHKQWWNSAIAMFTDLGYSITYKIINCLNYGVPQNRERVILFGACPGLRLPAIPPPTHGPPGSGLLPYVTIADTLAKLARHPSATHNSTSDGYAPIARSLPPYDANRTAWCITTGGSNGRPGTYHPSGRRDFTLRELAMLQGFPWDFEFAAGLTKTQIRRQIGNAVPPPLARALYRAVREGLESADRG